MLHPDDQLQAARDLLADGLPRAAAVDALRAQFGLSPATAYRRVAAAVELLGAEDLGDESGAESVDLAREALGTMLRLMQRAEESGDEPEALKRAQALANAIARLRILHLRL